MTTPGEMAELLERAESLASVVGAPFEKLTEKQRTFAAAYVMLGGNGTAAAELAGYVAPDVAAHRTLLNPRVSELVGVLSLADAKARLPIAIGVLVEIATDPKQPAAERRKCAIDLVKIAGAMPQGAPLVAMQVNQGQPSDAASVSVVIRKVWQGRDARLSSIAAPMPDALPAVNHADDDDAAAG